LSSPTATFMVSGGGVGQSYSIEALAHLSDGQIWIDHIMVGVTDCSASAGSGLLFGYGPIAIANTLYYNAIASQTVFYLGTPDEFHRVGTLVDSNVLVYVNGLRKEPVDDYTVSVRHNTITFITALFVGAEVTFDLVTPQPPPPVWLPPTLMTGGVISTALYYFATNGQTVFFLWTPDRFNHIGSIAPSGNILVYVNGLRKEPVDDYTINPTANTVTFTTPLTLNNEVGFDLVTLPPEYPPPILLTGGMISTTLYYLAIGGQTVFHLSTPDRFSHTGNIATTDGNALVYVNGLRKEPVYDYTISLGANTITFTSPVPVSAEVVFDLITAPPPVPVIPPPIVLNAGFIGTTLYYVGLGGQTIFSLGTPDEFNHVATMTTTGVQVYRSGNRLTLADGYTIDIANNRVILVYPAGDGEPIIIELTAPPPIPVLAAIALTTETLPITTLNTIPTLTYPPNGIMAV